MIAENADDAAKICCWHLYAMFILYPCPGQWSICSSASWLKMLIISWSFWQRQERVDSISEMIETR